MFNFEAISDYDTAVWGYVKISHILILQVANYCQ